MRALLLALALATLAQPPQKQRGAAQRDQPAPAYQRGTDSLPVSVKLLNTGKSPDETAQDAAHIKADQSAKAWDIGSTVATAVFTLGLLFVGYRQWRTSQAQQQTADHQRVIMELQAQIMGNTVATMERQRETMVNQEMLTGKTVAIMDETKERSLRAYLSIEADKPLFVGSKNNDAFYRFFGSVTNRGQTPAYHLRCASGAHVVSGIEFPNVSGMVEGPSIGILAPGHKIGIGEREAVCIAPHEMAHMKEGIRRLFFYGYFLYEDAFKKTWKQRFCYYVVFDPSSGSPVLAVADTENDEMCIGGQPSHYKHTPGVMHSIPSA